MSFQHPAQTRTGHQLSTSYPFTALAPPSFPSRPGTSILIDWSSEGSLIADNSARCCSSEDIRSRCRSQLTRITSDMLPDDVLLEIFDFYLDEDIAEDIEGQRIEEWITLTHVCRRWRNVVFQSPHRLKLRLLCTPKTPARDMDIWPPLPLIVHNSRSPGVGDIVAVLEHNDRVCRINLNHLFYFQLAYITNSAAMQKPFPELTHLRLGMFVNSGLEGKLPDSFLGGTAPRLRHLYLEDVPFPGVQKLLLSSTHLVNLDLLHIPRTGYISPEAMATSLSALTSLEHLCLDFQYPRPHSALDTQRSRPPPLTRSILPSLTKILFKGASEYLEEILARIDAPRLIGLEIMFFNQIIFDTPQLFQLISRRPMLRARERGYIIFNSKGIIVTFPAQTSDHDVLSVGILCTATEWQLSSIEQVCTSSLPPVSTLKELYIFESRKSLPRWQIDVENALWLELLHSVAAVKNLYLSAELAPRIAPALQELVGERTTEVLPTLENIFVERIWLTEPLPGGIERFVAARQLTSHPVAVSVSYYAGWRRQVGVPKIFDW